MIRTSTVTLTLMCALITGACAHPGKSSAHQHPHHYYGHHQHHHGTPHHGHWRKHHNGAWVWVPAVIGGVILYEMGRQNGSVERSPRDDEGRTCSEWREVQDSNGRVYRERTCTER